MTMHLVGPYLTTTKYRQDRQKITKSKQAELEQGWRDRNQRLKEMGLPKETLEQYTEWVYGRGKKTPKKKNNRSASSLPTTPAFSRPDKNSSKVLSKDQDRGKTCTSPKPWITGPVSSAPAKVYTGTKILGIATMHKSNLVPVFSDQEAVEISTMRRN